MSFLLDTNAVIAIMRRKPFEVREHWIRARSEGTPVATSSIVLFELHFGACRSARPVENLDRIAAVLSAPLPVLPFERSDAEVAGDVRATLQGKGTPIGPYDTLIAGQALRLGMTLVSANTREFRRVRGLKLANWEAP